MPAVSSKHPIFRHQALLDNLCTAVSSLPVVPAGHSCMQGLRLSKEVLQTGLQLAVRAIPLAGLSLLILPLPFTLPRLMALQATLPIAVLEGAACYYQCLNYDSIFGWTSHGVQQVKTAGPDVQRLGGRANYVTVVARSAG